MVVDAEGDLVRGRGVSLPCSEGLWFSMWSVPPSMRKLSQIVPLSATSYAQSTY